jgi:hypothetical protein
MHTRPRSYHGATAPPHFRWLSGVKMPVATRHKTMDEIIKLMTEQLRDAYSAEKQALRDMPRMMKKATAQSLKDAL